MSAYGVSVSGGSIVVTHDAHPFLCNWQDMVQRRGEGLDDKDKGEEKRMGSKEGWRE